MAVDLELDGVRKAAVLLLHMGKAVSAKVLSQLRESEVEALSAEIIRLGAVGQDVSSAVLDEFYTMTKERGRIAHGGVDYARELLISSLGRERAAEIVQRIGSTLNNAPFGFLDRADHQQLLPFLAEEHPQTVALVLAHAPAGLASLVLAGLPAEARGDVAIRVATMGRVAPETVARVSELLEHKLSSLLRPAGPMPSMGGVRPLVDIINRSDRATEKSILDGLARRSPQLADQVRGQMFRFEDLLSIDDRAIQLVLRQVDPADLPTALKGVRVDVRDKVLHNLSERAAENLLEEIELLGPVRLRTVEEAQAKIIAVIRSAEEAGEIVLRRGGDDDFVE